MRTEQPTKCTTSETEGKIGARKTSLSQSNFGIRVSLTFHLMFVHHLSSV